MTKVPDTLLKYGIHWTKNGMASKRGQKNLLLTKRNLNLLWQLRLIFCLHWGSEIQPFEIWPFNIRKHFNSRLFEGRISNGPVFKWSGFRYGYSVDPNHSKIGPFKVWTFLFGFQMVFEKMAAICLDFGFQIPFKIGTICNPTYFWQFEIWTSPDFVFPLNFLYYKNPPPPFLLYLSPYCNHSACLRLAIGHSWASQRVYFFYYGKKGKK